MNPAAIGTAAGSARDRARTLLEEGVDVPRELVVELLSEIDVLRDQLSLGTTFEQGYVDEIQRMNILVQELADYVETVADAVADSLGSDEITAQLRRQVVKLILQSSHAMHTSAKH